jgi:two-component system chemotaxis response regulator CheY
MRALVIDDSRAIRSIVTRTLAGLGIQTVEAGDGRAGLAELESTNGIGVVLVDWNMPEMDGLEFLETARARPEYAHIPMMMVTTESEHEQVLRALRAGADEYVMKPFTPVVLREKLELLGVLAPAS